MEMDRESSSDTDSSSSSDEETSQLEERASELEKQINVNSYLYDVHVELVGLYKKMGDLTSMRAAFERFHKHFPMTAALWLDWIQVEIKLMTNDGDKRKILDLFEKAIWDYQSVKLWQEYCQFAIGNCDANETRKIFDTCLNRVGLNVSKGSLIWNMLREFEYAHLSVVDPNSEEFKTQLTRVVEVFKRQLSVPLLDMEEVIKEWQIFLEQLPDDHGIDTKNIEWCYNKALKSLEIYKPFEEKLINAKDEEKYEIYKEYIGAIKDPLLIIQTYERIVADLCLNVKVWEDYCYYSIGLGEIAITVSKNALRNCPWSTSLWVLRLKILELNNKAENEIVECFEEAVSRSCESHVELWLSYIEYLFRNENDLKSDKTKEKIDKVFQQAFEQIGTNDSGNVLAKFYIRFLIKIDDIVKARKVWSEILHKFENKHAGYIWMEFIDFERRHGNVNNIRNAYQRALGNCTDWVEYFSQEWLAYERESSPLKNVIACMDKCRKTIDKLKYSVRNGDHAKADHVEKQNESKRNRDDEEDSVKRSKLEKPYVKVVLTPTDINTTLTVFVSNIRSTVTDRQLKELFPIASKVIVPTDRKGQSRCFAYIIFDKEEDALESLKRDREPIDGRPMFISKCVRDKSQRNPIFKYDNKKELNKLFVKGLPLYYDKSKVEELFKKYNPVDVRLVTKFNGQPKGLAYVDFANVEDAGKAMKDVDQMKVDDFVISVAISEPPVKSKASNPFETDVPNVPCHRRSKLGVSLVPRAVQMKKNPEESGKQTEVKTNEDFRKMLFNKS